METSKPETRQQRRYRERTEAKDPTRKPTKSIKNPFAY